MNEIQTMLDARKKYLTQLNKEKEKALEKAPEGSLRVSKKRKYISVLSESKTRGSYGYIYKTRRYESC